MSDLMNCNPKRGDIIEYSDEYINNFKAFYYMMNATPDNQIKVYDESKIINFEDIIYLNDSIERKLDNHNVTVNSCVISISFKDGNFKNYTSWDEFKRTDWNESLRTKSISFEWDFFLKLPKYEAPQRHTIRVRIGSALKASEYIQLLWQEENESKSRINMSDIVCKIDFIDLVICRELFGIVDNWHKGLKNSSGNKLYLSLAKNMDKLKNLFDLILYIGAFTMIFSLATIYVGDVEYIDWGVPNNIIALLKFIGISALIFMITYLLTNFLGNSIYKNAGKLQKETMILLTKSDKNNIVNSNKIAFQLFLNYLGAALYAVTVVIVTKIYSMLS